MPEKEKPKTTEETKIPAKPKKKTVKTVMFNGKEITEKRFAKLKRADLIK